MAKKVTLKDVAVKAGVSEKDAEKILENAPFKDEQAKVKVLRAAAELEYKHEPRALGRKSKTIALMAPFFYSPFVSEIVDGIEKKLVGTSYNASQYSTKGVLENERAIFRRVLETNMADAFILFNIPVDEDILREIKQKKIPLISIEKELPFFNFIVTDNMHGSFVGTEHLIKQGRKNIGIVIGKRYQPDIQNDRIKGYMNALDENGLKFDDNSIIVINEHDFDNGAEVFNSVIQQRKDLDAIFCMAGDIVATGIITEAKKRGVKIPEDLAIIGYDDLEIARYITPPLTTIRQPTRKMGEKAVELIIDYLTGREPPKPTEIVFKSELIKRESA